MNEKQKRIMALMEGLVYNSSLATAARNHALVQFLATLL
jgi:hypothetical protein